MKSQKLLTLLLMLLPLSWSAELAFGQAAPDGPIYLEEPEPEPAARASKRQPVTSKYDDDSVKVQRQVVKLSDGRILNDGKFLEYYRGGQKYKQGTFKMGVFEGEWKYWYPNGQLCKTIFYKKGKADGQWEVFNEEGVRTVQQGYRNGKRHGKWLVYHEGGEVPGSEIEYENGIPVGERISYYKSGKKRQSVPFKDGKLHGKMVELDEDGNKVAEVTFKDGKPEGKVVRFDN